MENYVLSFHLLYHKIYDTCLSDSLLFFAVVFDILDFGLEEFPQLNIVHSC